MSDTPAPDRIPVPHFDRPIDEAELRLGVHHFEGVALSYFDHDANDPVTGESGWYWGPDVAGVVENGPFPDFAAACADITDRPLRDEFQYAGPYIFYYGGSSPDSGWRYWEKGHEISTDEERAGPFPTLDAAIEDANLSDITNPDHPSERHKLRQVGDYAFVCVTDEGWRYWPILTPSNIIARGIPTFVEALKHSEGYDDPGLESRAEAHVPQPPFSDTVLGGLATMGIGLGPPLDHPTPGENFPPALATLINEFDWRNHSESLQEITRPFAVIAFALVRKAPHPYWTQRAMEELLVARDGAMRAWARIGAEVEQADGDQE